LIIYLDGISDQFLEANQGKYHGKNNEGTNNAHDNLLGSYPAFVLGHMLPLGCSYFQFLLIVARRTINPRAF
jgi:hypothetical protein